MRALRLLWRLSLGVAALLVLAIALIETPAGKAWLARTVARLASGPDRHVSITGLAGVVPLHMTAARVAVADAAGTWLTLHDVEVGVAAADLLHGRLRLRRVSVGEADVAHWPSVAGGSSSAPALMVEQLAIGRLVVRREVVGTAIAARVTGSARVAGEAAQVRLDIRRSDGVPGSLALDAALDRGRLAVRLNAEEPTGEVLARLLQRPDRLPLTMSLDGAGPLARWRGHLVASAGPLAHLDAAIGFDDGAAPVITASGTVSAAGLLPPLLAKLVGDGTRIALRAILAQPLRIDALTIETASGRLQGDAVFAGGDRVTGHLVAELPQLAAFATLAGVPLTGTARVSADIDATAGHARIEAIEATATGLRTGNARLDALVGETPRLSAAARWERPARLTVERLSVTGAALGLSGAGAVDVGAQRVEAGFGFALPRLAALAAGVSGQASGDATLAGPLHSPQLTARLSSDELGLGGVRLERLRLTAAVPDLSDPAATIDGSLRAAGVDATVAAAVARAADGAIALPRLRLAAADSSVAGQLRLDPGSGLASGSLTLQAKDLSRWSRLARLPLAGRLDARAELAAGAGQSVDLTVTGTGLAIGAGASRVAAGRLAATARLADILRTPKGRAEATLSAVRFRATALSQARIAVDGNGAGGFAFTGAAEGGKTRLSLAGDAQVGGGRTQLRFARFAGTLDGMAVRLERPLMLTRAGADIAVPDFAMRLDRGRISGAFARRGEALSARLAVADLPLATLTRGNGERRVRGTLSISATLGGSLAAPRGHLSAEAANLGFAMPHRDLPRLGVALTGDWDGRELTGKGRITGLRGDTLTFDGALPLRLTRAPLAVSLPPDGRLTARLRGRGDLAALEGLLPLGEDRLTGRYTVDVAAGGTLAAPTATGRLRISDARYQSFASGAVLTGLQAEIAGDRHRLEIASLSAGDGAGGKLTASGQVQLASPAPTVDITAKLAGFRIAARDEATATATGSLRLEGALTAPKIGGSLTVDRADIRIPDSLPPSVARIPVVFADGGKPAAAVPPARPPGVVLPLALDVAMPGQVFVRGRGLDSEWRGRLRVAGTTAAPLVTGQLAIVRGSYNALGKTFRLQSGTILFSGGSLDPELDILAEAAASDITAQIRIAGTASAPTIALTSTPALPQDEILSRVLFGQGIGQISAAQGVEIAQAAAALAGGGGTGIIDTLRSGLGLDRLGIGQTQGIASILNPAGAAPSATSPTTGVTAGKYVAPGVYVGVAQGLTSASSKVQVEVQLRPHLSVETDLGESGSSGIGLNYKYDY